MSKKLAAIEPSPLAEHHHARTRYGENPFIHGNNLRQRWQALPPQRDSTFVIGANSFSAGLDFIATAERWLRWAPATARLHFIALEAAPLGTTDLQQILRQATPYNELASQLINNYPMLNPGFHRLFFAKQRICLTLILIDTDSDVAAGLAQLRPSLHPATRDNQGFYVDAWFITSPTPTTLFEHIKQLSGANTTLGSVNTDEATKEQLEKRGFVLKNSGRSDDNHGVLCGLWQAPKTVTQTVLEKPQPPRHKRKSRYQCPWYVNASPHRSPSRHAAIIGGGIAGCTTAAALAQRGWRVTLYEQNKTLANEGSGNPQGIVYPKISPQSSALSRINLSAIQFASRYYQRYWQSSANQATFGQQCGVLVLPEREREAAAFTTIAHHFKQQKAFIQLLDKSAIEKIAGFSINAEIALYYPQLGWLNPPNICRALLRHPLITVEQASIRTLTYDDSAANWELSSDANNEVAAADTVVLATSTSTKQFKQTEHLPIKAIRGQISIAPSHNQAAGTSPLKTVVCGAGYIAPAQDSQHTFGATYNLNNPCLDVRIADHQHNIDLLEQSASGLPSALQIPPAQQLSGRAALRCTTLDYLPIVGPAPRVEAFLEDYADLRRDASTDIPTLGKYWPGLFVHCGLGSRGLSYAPLGAELLASQINGEPPPLEQELVTALNPARFIIRDMKRRKI